jgi:F-type H+-transporting ATPase subunit h
MYLRELKVYKSPTVKASDAEGHVQKFSTPKAPRSPEEGDLAGDLSSYQSSAVEVEGQSSEAGAAPGQSAVEAWFEELDEHIRDDPKEGVHH